MLLDVTTICFLCYQINAEGRTTKKASGVAQRRKNTTHLQTWFGGSFEQKIEEGYVKR